MHSFWEASWEDGFQPWTQEKGAYDPSKIHKITFKGQYYSTEAFSQSHPSPQRTPVLFQAGSSKAGSIFSSRHAEAIFCGGGKPEHLTETIKNIRKMAIAEGRDPYDVKFFPQITPIIGRTLEEAQAKYAYGKKLAEAAWEGGIACVSGFTGLDLSQFPLDEPLKFDGQLKDNAVHTMVEAVQRIMTPGMTPRQLGAEFAFCGFACMPVGTPDMVADVIEEWITVADIDGFNIACKPEKISLFSQSIQIWMNHMLTSHRCLQPRFLR